MTETEYDTLTELRNKAVKYDYLKTKTFSVFT